MINNALKFGVIMMSVFFITNCAGNRIIYSYRGINFYNKEDALFAQQTHLNNLLSQIQSFKNPLVDKKLIVSIPAKDQIYSTLVSSFSKINKSAGSNFSSDLIDYNAQRLHESYRSTYNNIKKMNIYKTVELVEGTYSTIIQPSPTCDTFCYFSSGAGNDIWFMLNVKNGKQVFAYDRSLPEGPTRTESFCNAIKAFALQ
jgi:hypothetical protein